MRELRETTTATTLPLTLVQNPDYPQTTRRGGPTRKYRHQSKASRVTGRRVFWWDLDYAVWYAHTLLLQDHPEIRAMFTGPEPEAAPEPEHVKLEGQRLEDDRALRGPATVKAAKTRRTRHEGNVACMNVHRGTHAAWLDAQASTPDVVAEAEAIVAETPAVSQATIETLTLAVAQLAELVGEIAINTRTNA